MQMFYGKFGQDKVEEHEYDGYFEIGRKRYPMKTKYLKCSDCNIEYFGQDQIKENQEYLRNVKAGEDILPN